MKEQVEHQRELKDLPGNLDYRRESPTVQSYIDGSPEGMEEVRRLPGRNTT